MKILYIDTPINPPGGGQISLVLLLSQLDAIEKKVFIPAAGEAEKFFKDKGIDYEVVEIKKLLGKIREYKPDIIHSNSGTTKYCFFAAVFAFFLGIKFVWHTRVARKVFLKDDIIAFFSDKIIAISSAVKNKFNSFWHKKIEIIHNPVEESENFSLADKSAFFKPEAKVIGIFARLEADKGHSFLFKCFRRISLENDKARLLIVGDGEEMESLKKEALGLGILEKSVFLGYVKNPLDFMAFCDVVAAPSIFPEGFGRSLAEAQLLGKAVIASAIGGHVDIIDNGKDGFLSDFDEVLWSKTILRLFSDEKLYLFICANAKIKAQKLFSAKEISEKIKLLYSSIL